MNLMAALLELWDDARRAFKQRRVWERARRLGLSQLVCIERHTITGLLCSGGRQFEDWSADYRLFSRDVWTPNHLFRTVVAGSLNLLPRRGRLVMAIDDTLLHKTSKNTPGVAYRRDPLSPAFQANLVLAQRFIQFSLLVPVHAELPSSARAVPCRFAHAPSVKKPKRTAPQEEQDAYREAARQKNLNTVTCGMLQQFRDELDQVHHAADVHLALVVDGSYTNKTILKTLPCNTTLIGRIRKDAKLHFLNDTDPKKYGPRAPTPNELRQDEQHPWQVVEAYAAGKTHTFRIKTLSPVRWRTTGTRLPLRVVVIAPVGYRLTEHGRLLYRQPAYLICTDLDLPLQQLLQEYLWRWDIEVNHRDEKQIIGVGQAQVWSPESVERQPAFAVANYAMLLLAALNAFGTDDFDVLPLPKWQERLQDERPSTQRLIQILRYETWGLALEEVTRNDRTNDFATGMVPDTKSPELILAPAPPLAYARNG